MHFQENVYIDLSASSSCIEWEANKNRTNDVAFECFDFIVCTTYKRQGHTFDEMIPSSATALKKKNENRKQKRFHTKKENRKKID